LRRESGFPDWRKTEVEENIIQFSSQHVITQLSLRSVCQENLDNSPRNSFTPHLTSEQDDWVMRTGGVDGPPSMSSDSGTATLIISDDGFTPKSLLET